MIKKMMLLAVSAAAVVAFAVPAAASAEAIVTDGIGLPAANVTAVSTDTVSKTPTGTLSCKTVNLNVTLTQNDTERATGHGDGTAVGNKTTPHSGTCEVVELGAPIVKITEIDVKHIQLNGDGTGSATFTYAYDLFTPAQQSCHFEGTVGVTYASGSNVLNIAGSMKGKALNPESTCNESGEISGKFEVFDEFAQPVEIH